MSIISNASQAMARLNRSVQELEQTQIRFVEQGQVGYFRRTDENIDPVVEFKQTQQQLIQRINELFPSAAEAMDSLKSAKKSPQTELLNIQFEQLQKKSKDLINKQEEAINLGSLTVKVDQTRRQSPVFNYARPKDNLEPYYAIKKPIQLLLAEALQIKAPRFEDQLSNLRMTLLELETLRKDNKNETKNEIFDHLHHIVRKAVREERELQPEELKQCKDLLKKLSSTKLYKEIGGNIWTLAGGHNVKTNGDGDWGGNHAFDNAKRALEALEKTKGFNDRHHYYYEPREFNLEELQQEPQIEIPNDLKAEESDEEKSLSNEEIKPFQPKPYYTGSGLTYYIAENGRPYAINEEGDPYWIEFGEEDKVLQVLDVEENVPYNQMERKEEAPIVIQQQPAPKKIPNFDEELGMLAANLSKEELQENLQVLKVMYESDKENRENVEDRACYHMYFYHLKTKGPKGVEGVYNYGGKTLYAPETSEQDIKECVRRTRIEMIMSSLGNAIETRNNELVKKYFDLLAKEDGQTFNEIQKHTYFLCRDGEDVDRQDTKKINLKHPGFGYAGFCNQDGCEAPTEVKQKAFELAFEALTELWDYKQ